MSRDDTSPLPSPKTRRFDEPAEVARRDALWGSPLFFTTHEGRVETARSIDDLARSWSRVDERSLLDYLVLGYPRDPSASLFADIHRLPPGRSLTASGECVAWYEPPTMLPADLGRGAQVVDMFWETFVRSVERCGRSGKPLVLALSGGLDSAAIAAAIAELAWSSRTRAVTFAYGDDPRDDEPAVAKQLASHAGLDWERIDISNDDPFAPPSRPVGWPSSPSSEPHLAWIERTSGAIVLYGYGGDDLLRGNPHHYADRVRRRELAAMVGDVFRTTIIHGSRPGFGLQRRLRGRRPKKPIPRFIAADARARARRLLDDEVDPDVSTAAELLTSPGWSGVLDARDPQAETALPFFDADLLALIARLPTAPWCLNKEILRAALRGRVPELIRTRAKSPVRFDPVCALPSSSARRAVADVRRAGLHDLIDVERWAEAALSGSCRYSERTDLMRPVAIARWLEQSGVTR